MRFTASDLVYTARTTDNTAAVYVFSREGAGFVITSADDVATPVLGYSDRGTITATQMPDNMVWWLGEYSREIEYAAKHPMRMLNAPQRPVRDPIAPLCSTRWNQGSPYNNLCPVISGRHTYSGCVATAMAQVMKHHNWPVTGRGKKSYTWNGQTLSMDFSATTFDWAHMTDTYSSKSTDEENAAVALLMSACGISVNMNYGLNGSGAQSAVVPNALRNYFNYGKCTTMIHRDVTPLLDWEEYIYNSLKNNAPAYYSGQNMSVGHAFVCDGYSADGYFHFNWGWGGVSDGYFLLTALDPSSQGIGGSNDGYNIYQSVILNALPKDINNEPMLIFLSNQTVTPQYDAATETLTLAGRFVNQGYGTVSTRFGLKVQNIATNQENVYTNGELQSLSVNGSVGYINAKVAKPADGMYTVTPVFDATPAADAPTWKEMLMPLGEPTIAYMKISGDSIEFSTPEYDLMSSSQPQLLTPFYVNNNYNIKFTITNTLPTEVYEYFFVGLIKDNNLVSVSDPYSIDLMGNESQEINFIGKFSGVEPGAYTLGIIQLAGNNAYLISEPLTINMKANEGAIYNVTNLKVANSDNVNCSDIHFSFTLNNEQGFFSFPITAYISTVTNNYASQTFGPYFIEGTGNRDFNLSMSAPNLTVGNDYYLLLGILGENNGQVQFHVSTNAVNGIAADSRWQLEGNELTAPEAISSVHIYNMAGIDLNIEAAVEGNKATLHTSSLSKGFYIMHAATANSNWTKKIVIP